jgi:hypothetical protein
MLDYAITTGNLVALWGKKTKIIKLLKLLKNSEIL